MTKNTIFKEDGRAIDAAVVAPCTEHIDLLPVVCVEARADAAPAYDVDITRVLAVGAGALRRIQDCTEDDRLPQFYEQVTVFGIFFSVFCVTVFRMVPVCLGESGTTRDMMVRCEEFRTAVDDASEAVDELIRVVPQLHAELQRTVGFMAGCSGVVKNEHERKAALPDAASEPDDEPCDRVAAILDQSGVNAAISRHKNPFNLALADFDALIVEHRTQVVGRDVPRDVLVLKSGLGAEREFEAREKLRYSSSVVRATFMHFMADEGILIMVFPSLLSAGDVVGAVKFRGDSGCRVFAVEVLRGLRDLHALGLAHRDVKPDNIRGGRGGVALTDFDLAKPIAELRPGSGAGTTGFIAPEARGDDDQSVTVEAKYDAEKLARYRRLIPAELDVRCGCEGGHALSGAIDLWSLGVVLASLYGVTPRTPRVWTELSSASTATEIIECLLNPCPEARGTAEGVVAQLS